MERMVITIIRPIAASPMNYPSLFKILLFACGLSPAVAIEFYNADFSVDGQGATHDSAGGDPLEMSPIAGENWQIRWDVDPGSDATSNSFITSGGKLISGDWGGRAIFETDPINVSALDSVIVTTLAQTVGTDVFNSGAEDFTWFYILDGGSRVSQFPIKADGPLDYSESVDVSGAGSLVVGFEFQIDGAGDGFEIYSVRVDDSVPLDLSLTLPERLAESASGGGMTEGTGQVSIAAAEGADLVIDLTSSDLTEATVPTAVTILAGQLSADFTITSVDDLEADGDQSVTVTATAEGFTDAIGTVIVEDDEIAAPTISLTADPASVSENGGISIVTIEVSSASALGYTFELSGNDPDELAVPASVTIAATETTATFAVTGADDDDSDGSQTVTITANDPAMVIAPMTLEIEVLDDEPFNAPVIAINEIRTDNIDIDTEEYLEIYGATAGYSLDRVWLIVLGDGTNDSTGFVERAYDLTGRTAVGKFFLVGNDNMTGATPDLTVGTNIFENNDSLTFLLVTDFTGARNDDLDTDNDGTLDVMPWASIIDAVSLLDTDSPPESGGFGYAESLGFIGANLAPVTGPTPAHLYRSPSGNGAWVVGPFGSDEEPALDTPGTDNGGDPVIPTKTTITGISVSRTTGQVILTASGLEGHSYAIESSLDLGQIDDWALVTEVVTESDNGDAVDVTFNDPETVIEARIFYRLLKQ